MECKNKLRANWELYLSQQLMQIHRQQLPTNKRSYHIVVRKLSVEMGEVHSSSVVSLPRRSLLLCVCSICQCKSGQCASKSPAKRNVVDAVHATGQKRSLAWSARPVVQQVLIKSNYERYSTLIQSVCAHTHSISINSSL